METTLISKHTRATSTKLVTWNTWRTSWQNWGKREEWRRIVSSGSTILQSRRWLRRNWNKVRVTGIKISKHISKAHFCWKNLVWITVQTMSTSSLRILIIGRRGISESPSTMILRQEWSHRLDSSSTYSSHTSSNTTKISSRLSWTLKWGKHNLHFWTTSKYSTCCCPITSVKRRREMIRTTRNWHLKFLVWLKRPVSKTLSLTLRNTLRLTWWNAKINWVSNICVAMISFSKVVRNWSRSRMTWSTTTKLSTPSSR